MNGKYLKVVILSLLIALMMIVLLTSCKKNDMNTSISDSKFLLGTIITLQLFGSEDETLIEESFKIIESIDNQMSLNIVDSELSELNNSAGKGPYPLTDSLFYILEKSLEYGEISSGKLDVTLEPVIRLWGIGSDKAAVPSDKELEKALKNVDYTKVILNREDKTAELLSGMSVDLGSIGKGYAADVVADYLKGKGIKKAILNLGGNILIIGEKEESVPFRVGLQDPFESRNEYFGVVEVIDKTVVTSGIYERNFEQDGVLYHHLLDTKTGYPVSNGVTSVAIIADSSIDADAMSTVLFVLGVEEGLKLCETISSVECVYVASDYQVYMSSGAKDIITITNSKFIVAN